MNTQPTKKHRIFEDVCEMEWKNWRWQIANSIHDIKGLENLLDLSPEELAGIEKAGRAFRWAITPYYASLMSAEDPNCPVRLQAIPDVRELDDEDGLLDPLQEENHSPVRDMIHLYPNRVALCVSDLCMSYCRHCFRKRRTLRSYDKNDFAPALEYIRAHEEINDVLVTGGDPLMMDDDSLCEKLAALRQIKHVKLLRIGTRAPVTLPYRITPQLAKRLAEFHPLYINTQFNHPKEITPESARAVDLLLKAGIPVGNQSVLLKGINDERDTLKSLLEKLLEIRVRPYYIFHPHRQSGTRHFRLSVDRGMEIMSSLRGYTSGMAIPTYALDTPHGKVPLCDNRIIKNDEKGTLVRTFDGTEWFELKEE